MSAWSGPTATTDHLTGLVPMAPAFIGRAVARDGMRNPRRSMTPMMVSPLICGSVEVSRNR